MLSFTQPLISSSTQLNHAGPTREVLFTRDLSCAHTYTRGLRPPSFAVHPALLPVPNNQAYAYLPRRSSTKSFIAFPGMRLRGDAGVERDGALSRDQNVHRRTRGVAQVQECLRAVEWRRIELDTQTDAHTIFGKPLK